MKLILDEKNNVLGYITHGDVEGAVDTPFEPDVFQYDCTFYKYNENELILDVSKITDMQLSDIKEKRTQPLKDEIDELIEWFSWYDNQVNQYQRCVRLGVEFDQDIDELDNQAKIKQERIRELRNTLAAIDNI